MKLKKAQGAEYSPKALSSTKAQAWGFDLTIGFVIFTVAIVSFYFFAVNYPTDNEENFQEMQYEGQLIGDNLLSEGSPLDWTSDNVLRIGIVSDDKINETKLARFAALAGSDYGRTKTLFNVRHDYLLNFSESLDVGGAQVQQIGNVDFSSENLVKVIRLSSYKGEPITLSIYLSD
ncbi:hypothetical protein J4402_02850 [Candidatus Pacearchaeota archaeon]|nr:hypothetical protein [Candidatus Pacearchaeota archaeon]